MKDTFNWFSDELGLFMGEGDEQTQTIKDSKRRIVWEKVEKKSTVHSFLYPKPLVDDNL